MDEIMLARTVVRHTDDNGTYFECTVNNCLHRFAFLDYDTLGEFLAAVQRHYWNNHG